MSPDDMIDHDTRRAAFGGSDGDACEARGAQLMEWLHDEFIARADDQGRRLNAVIQALNSLSDGPFPSRAKEGFAVMLTAALDAAWDIDGTRLREGSADQ